MSPLEAKQYGLIDHVIGGDEAGFKVGMAHMLLRLLSVACRRCQLSACQHRTPSVQWHVGAAEVVSCAACTVRCCY